MKKSSPKFKDKKFRTTFLKTFTSGFDYGKISQGEHNRVFGRMKKYTNKVFGYLSSLFLFFYGTFRFIIEFTREPDTHIGLIFFGLSMGQIISGIFFIAGTILFYKSYVSEKR